MINYKRFGGGILSGAVLGVFCILGASGRVGGWSGNEILLLGLWYNRVIMGLIIGLDSPVILVKEIKGAKWFNSVIRGGTIGTLISLQFYLSTVFLDLPTFLAGIAYGVIIDLIATVIELKIT